MIPVTVAKNGHGPTAILTGANHGDEYEGPVALQALAYTLDPADVQGRVIIVPYLEYERTDELGKLDQCAARAAMRADYYRCFDRGAKIPAANAEGATADR